MTTKRRRDENEVSPEGNTVEDGPGGWLCILDKHTIDSGCVISLNSTKSSPDLGPISGYSDYPWSPTSVPPRITWITWTIWLLRLSMTLYGLPHLDLIVSLSCYLLNLTCTRLALRDPVSMPLGSSGTAPHLFPRILYLAAARTSTFPKHTAFGLQTLPFYYTI